MATAKELKEYIQDISQTRKITKAMYLISSSKLSRAKAELDRTRPYFNALQMEIKRIFRTASDVESRYFYSDDAVSHPDGVFGCLVITSDKGLAGAYNQNVIREAMKLYAEHKETRFYVVGEYGRHSFFRRNVPIERSFLYTAQNPTMNRAREISDVLLTDYHAGKVSKILVIYTDLKNGLETACKNVRLIPFHKNQFHFPENEKKVTVPFEFVPSVSAILDHIIGSYISGYLYSALIDSFCSEQQARMTAMDSAVRKADKLLQSLSVEYNRIRQGSITTAITEISSVAVVKRRNAEGGIPQ